MFSQSQAAILYNGARKWFTISSVVLFPVLFFIDAPFGRFALSGDSIFTIDGVKSWMVMELVSPTFFLYTFFKSPLSFMFPSNPPRNAPQIILATLFLIHYTNRALISPLRTPSRSKSHIVVTLSGIFFNTINGSIMGAYLSSPFARIYLTSNYTFHRPSFYIGVTLWVLGFAGNVLHDEILLNIRRKAKNKEDSGDKSPQKRLQEHYAIPQGWLYNYISYPNYFCEWIEWLGFALAAGPIPFSMTSFTVESVASFFSPGNISSLIFDPGYLFAQNLAPPYIFLLSEVLLMFPRAYKGHQWYKNRFGEQYPKERKIVIPFIL